VRSALEQQRAVEQIGMAINEIDNVIQVTAASSEEAAAALEQLSAQAFTLKQAVVDLLAMVGPGGGRNVIGIRGAETTAQGH